jgi:integrase
MGKASNGDGGVYKRKLADGSIVWDVRWTFTDDFGATKRGVRGGFTSKEAAATFRRDVTKRVDLGVYVKPSKILVRDFLALWMDGLRLKPQTIAGYRRKVRLHVLPYIGHIPLVDVTGPILDRLYSSLEREGSPGGKGPLGASSIREIHHILSGAYSAAIHSGAYGVVLAPTSRATPPSPREVRAARPEFKTWSGQQLRAFLTAMVDDHYGALWHLLAATGVRRGEALGLRWADVDLANGRISVRQTIGEDRVPEVLEDGTVRIKRILIVGSTKGDKPRVVSIDAGTVVVLKAHRSRQVAERLSLADRWEDNDLVFCRGRRWLKAEDLAGTMLDPERITEAFIRDVARTALPRIRLHDLRHTWASLALQSGVHPKVVQERLGHSTIAVTLDIYSHVTPGLDAEAAETVAALFS